MLESLALVITLKGFHTTLDGRVQKIYRTATKDCKACPMKSTCVPNKTWRQIIRTVYDEQYLRAFSRQHSKRGRQMKKIKNKGLTCFYHFHAQIHPAKKHH